MACECRDILDFGNVSDVWIDGVGKWEEIAPSTYRLSFYSTQRAPDREFKKLEASFIVYLPRFHGSINELFAALAGSSLVQIGQSLMQ